MASKKNSGTGRSALRLSDVARLGLTGLLLSHAIARRSPSALIPLAGFV